jgi:bifunctional aspartokinase / homoserine dehydrogenase 1
MHKKYIFLIGPGNVGKKLLEYISEYNKANPKSPIILSGLMNSRHMLLGKNLGSASMTRLGNCPEPNLEKLLRFTRTIKSEKKIIVDCTASQEISDWYLPFAKVGLNIVSANKFFNAGTYRNYKKLRDLCKSQGKKFLYTTNVGSGIPLIPTLKSFLASGDKVTKIEGIFSGSLSYLFNSIQNGKLFSETIKKAIKLGYMEPDPRQDLTGSDVARKLLIISRELGHKSEISQVKVQNIVPKRLRTIKNIATVISKLGDYDDYFKKISTSAKKNRKTLKYVGVWANGKMSAKLTKVSLSNPISQTRDMDNIFVIYTKRYDKRPFILWGAGAGAKVTAFGVLRDILEI